MGREDREWWKLSSKVRETILKIYQWFYSKFMGPTSWFPLTAWSKRITTEEVTEQLSVTTGIVGCIGKKPVKLFEAGQLSKAGLTKTLAEASPVCSAEHTHTKSESTTGVYKSNRYP